VSELGLLAERSLANGDGERGRLGFQLLAYLTWERGDLGEAQRQMQRAESIGRAGDERAQVVAIAEMARCLVLLERDLPRAEALALEARARAASGPRLPAIADALGLIRQHQGRLDEAGALFRESRAESRAAGDGMGEFLAIEHLVVLLSEREAWREALDLAAELERLAVKLREGSEVPFARALLALSRMALGEDAAAALLDEAVNGLRVADAKLRLAYALTRAARFDLARGDAARAKERAEEAYRAAAAVGRPSETLLAGVALARALAALGVPDGVRGLTGELGRLVETASVLARRELGALPEV
jgi:hypothetical protein